MTPGQPGQAAERARIAERLRALIPDGAARILLVQPLQVAEAKIDPQFALRRRYYNYPPYGLGILSNILKARGFETRIVDLNTAVFTARGGQLVETASAADMTACWQDELRRAMADFEPDLVAITCMFTMTHPMLIGAAEFIKAMDPEIPVAAGGVHVTNAAEMIMAETGAIDFIGLYEGDEAFIAAIDVGRGAAADDALRQVAMTIDGGYVALGGGMATPPADLDTVPDYLGLDVGGYSELGEIGTFRFWRPTGARSSPVLSNRGCRAQCSFCSVRNFNGYGVRGRSVGSVIDEIKSLHGDHGITHLTWLDDDLFYDVPRMLKLFEEIAGLPFEITWDASNGIIASAAAAHPELVEAAAASGCIGMYFGIESGNTDILSAVKKPSGIKHYLKVGELMQAHPQIFVRGFLIVGFPNETIGQILDTVQLARDMNLDWYTVQLLTPLPNTPIYQEMVDLGLIESGELNTEGEGFTMFSVREGERQRRREARPEPETAAFFDLFAQPHDHVPTKPQLNDIWLTADYEINYARLADMDDPQKLAKIGRFLTDIADRMTLDHPLANYFLGRIHEKLGDSEESGERSRHAARLLENSEYWRQRFEKLGLPSAI